ncbi:BnaCnng65710D, partial [Brassica napus]
LSKLFLFGLYGLPFLNLGEFLIIQVSKDIKYADKQPIIPWGSKSSRNDMLINLAIATVFSAWIAIQRSVEYKPLQFMSFVFMYIIFEKLKSFEAPSSPTLT